MKSRTKAHIALFIVATIYSLNYIVAKEVMPTYIGPRGFIFLRVSGAMLLFFLFSQFFKSEQKIARNDWWRVVVCGFFGIAGNQLLFFEGLNLTSPINASVIMTSNPVLVFAMSALLLKEPLKKWRLFGVILGGIGAIYLIMGRGEVSLIDSNRSMGNLLVFLNAASYAVYLVLVKPLMKKYDALLVIKWVFLAGFCFVIPAGIGQFASVEWTLWTPAIIWQAAFVVVCTTFVAYLFNIYALKTLSSTTVSTYIYLQPLLTTTIALLAGKDQLSTQTVVAALLIFVGVYLASFSKK